MADNFHKVKGGITLSSNPSPNNIEDGDLFYDGYGLKLYSTSINDFVSFASSTWRAVTSNETLIVNDRVLADTTLGSFSLTLPSSPNTGDEVEILDPASSWGTYNLTITTGLSQKIDGSLVDFIITTPKKAYKLIYYAPTNDWIVYRPSTSYGS